MQGLALILAIVYLSSRWAFSTLKDRLNVPAERRVLTGISAGVVMLFMALGSIGARPADWFSSPLTKAVLGQASLLVATHSESARADLTKAPPLAASNLRGVTGADVFVVFVESYGATTYDRDAYVRGLRESRDHFARALAAGNLKVVSAFVESPTFAGVSWLAHASLLSGLEVRDNRTYQSLLKSGRETLLSRFAAQGYRPVALMPGLKQPWPEGSFYGYSQLYDEPGLSYHGPAFGWWRIPDQYALAILHDRELPNAPRAPLFVVFPTINTHIPFRPTPPFQPDWRKMLSQSAYPGEWVATSLATETDWTNLGSGYIDCLAYTLTYLGDYLEKHAPQDLVMIILGDHQPAALISGTHATYEVPVHVISNRSAILDALLQAGFERGLTPRRPKVGRMHELTSLLLAAFHES